MYINNKLRDLVYRNNLLHGFWDNYRTYEEFVHNLTQEFKEAMDELRSGRKPTEVYFRKGNKPEGAPTELADIIIFILDYFGASNPQVDIDEAFLEEPDEYYKNSQWYSLKRQKAPWQYFIEITDACMEHIALSSYDNLRYGNQEFVAADGKTHSTPRELHHVIKLILEFCDVCEIDMEKELIDKINYNNSRPRGYRKIGSYELLETDPDKVMNEALNFGYGMYKQASEIVRERDMMNAEVLRRRGEKEELLQEEAKRGKR